jgi:hypothetical protein
MTEGGCLCGSVRYRVTGKPLATILCHCTHCQKSGGSAFSTNLLFKQDGVEVIGALSRYEDIADNGSAVYRCFCPNCGSSVMSILSSAPEVVVIKAGTLDDTSELRPTAQYWRRSAQPWVDGMAELPAFQTTRSAD